MKKLALLLIVGISICFSAVAQTNTSSEHCNQLAKTEGYKINVNNSQLAHIEGIKPKANIKDLVPVSDIKPNVFFKSIINDNTSVHYNLKQEEFIDTTNVSKMK